MKIETQSQAICAGHRVIIKRAMRLSGFTPDQRTNTERLSSWAKAHPVFVEIIVRQWFEAAAKCWERGNNSGSNEILHKEEANCELKHLQAESVLALWDIVCDYPGLYPTFKYQDRNYYDLNFLRDIAI
jgi:hypothetical protein